MSSDQIGIRITPDFQRYADKLKEIADAKHISVSHLARAIIIDHLSRLEGSGEVTKSEDVEDICRAVFSELLKSEEFRDVQKEIMRETLKEMAE